MRALLPAVLALLGLALANRLLLRRQALLPAVPLASSSALRDEPAVALATAFTLLVALGFAALLDPLLRALGLPWSSVLAWLPAIALAVTASGGLLHWALAGAVPWRPLLILAGGNTALIGPALSGLWPAADVAGTLWRGLAAGMLFGLLLLLLATLERRLDEAAVPAPLRGLPVLLLATTTLALAFWLGLGGDRTP